VLTGIADCKKKQLKLNFKLGIILEEQRRIKAKAKSADQDSLTSRYSLISWFRGGTSSAKAAESGLSA